MVMVYDLKFTSQSIYRQLSLTCLTLSWYPIIKDTRIIQHGAVSFCSHWHMLLVYYQIKYLLELTVEIIGKYYVHFHCLKNNIPADS